MITRHPGDLLEVIPRLVAEGVICDAVVTDPPYHLTATQQRFGEADSAPAQFGRDGAMSRLSGGFMGQQWDGGDIAFRPETWATIATALRPGAFLVAFGGTRTYHRLACAIEDAGFVIQDTIAWLYGSGFPKRRDMLKPAFEPICLAYKPGGKRTMQVDECRIAGVVPAFDYFETGSKRGYDGGIKGGARTGVMRDGRWPANVCHDGSEEVTEGFPDTGISVGGYRGAGERQNGYGMKADADKQPVGFGDTGSAARFFYCAKADAQDRWGSRHPTVKPVELMKWLVALVTPAGGLVLDPFAGSGTTGIGALATGRDCILIEREPQYLADIRERLAFYEGGGMHSIQAKNRNRGNDVGALRDGGRGRPMADAGPLFAQPYDPDADAREFYNVAVRACGERYRAGEPLGQFFLPRDARRMRAARDALPLFDAAKGGLSRKP